MVPTAWPGTLKRRVDVCLLYGQSRLLLLLQQPQKLILNLHLTGVYLVLAFGQFFEPLLIAANLLRRFALHSDQRLHFTLNSVHCSFKVLCSASNPAMGEVFCSGWPGSARNRPRGFSGKVVKVSDDAEILAVEIAVSRSYSEGRQAKH